ncbi:MAG: hypothetical protein ACRDV9_01600 [Acidimicrobiia bacterium]
MSETVPSTSRHRRLAVLSISMLILAALTVLGALLASPAWALSDIRNSIWMSDRDLAHPQTVEINAASSDSVTEDPFWRFDCGTLFIRSGAQRHVYSHARTRERQPGELGGRKIHSQAKYDYGKIASCGGAAEWRTTSHNKRDEA